MKFRSILPLCFMFILLSIATTVFAADGPVLKPYILGYKGLGTIAEKLDSVKSALEQQGFQVKGEYSPYDGTHIIVITSNALRDNAALSKTGAYGAMQRISLTETANEIQIAYTNPVYMANTYRMKDDLSAVAAKLGTALGKIADFGSKDGITAKKLRKYHYMIMMPYFTDQIELASYSSHDEAVGTVEKNLADGKSGSVKVYRIDLPGKNETVFGVGLKEGKGADSTVMNVTDRAELKHSAHLPYELIIADGDIFMLHGKFRIAQSFPDLTMPTFMKISLAPGGIEKALKAVANKP